MTAKIKIENLKKSFAGKYILKGVSLEVAPQESLVIIGTSGCGNSVTLKCLLGLITPGDGAIYIDCQLHGHSIVFWGLIT